MRYNTQKEKLILPEYGRNIQNMVDHCMGIENARNVPNARTRLSTSWGTCSHT